MTPTKPKEVPRQVESTPERILREFNERAKAYKMAVQLPKKDQGKLADEKVDLLKKISVKTEATKGVDVRKVWRDLMHECKEEFELTTEDMYNPSPSVFYDAYLVNLSHTVGARLS